MFRLIKALIEFISNLDKRGGTNGSSSPTGSSDDKKIKRLLILLPTFFVFLALLSSVYTIDPGEVGVVQRFGKLSGYTDPGLHLKIPFVDKLTKVNVEQVRRIEIGFRSDRARINVLQESLMITKDENIVDAQAIIQWKIKDPGNFLFKVANPEITIKNTAEVALRSAMGITKIDDALTTGRDQIQVKTREFLQLLLDSYNSGVQITDVKLQIVDPPEEVKDAFNEVVRAKEDKERLINEAKAFFELTRFLCAAAWAHVLSSTVGRQTCLIILVSEMLASYSFWHLASYSCLTSESSEHFSILHFINCCFLKNVTICFMFHPKFFLHL